jgi:ubiquinone/menaquinone biosynthesis C-methylase UbiE
MKKLIRELLTIMHLGVLNKYALEVYRLMAGCSVVSLKIPFTFFYLVPLKAASAYKAKINEGGVGHILPIETELPETALLNWKPLEDRALVKKTALDYRTEISSNQYAQAYRNKWQGKLSVSSGRTFWRLETMRQIRRANPDIFKGKVMEVGAGTGIVSATLSNFDEIDEVFCLDYDEYTVENLMPLVEYALDADASKITRVVGSYNKMECADASFDAVVAVGAMHHSEDLLATMSECYRVLKPGGHFIISDYALANNTSQPEYSMLINKPISDAEAEKYEASGSYEGVRTNKSISEHARPLFIYQAAAFNAGFNVLTYVFDANKYNGQCMSRMYRRFKSILKANSFYKLSHDIKEHGYDAFGNVKSFVMSDEVHYPFYAKDAPSLLQLGLLGDKAGKPVYDNIVLILQKPLDNNEKLPFRYRNGKVFFFPTDS